MPRQARTPGAQRALTMQNTDTSAAARPRILIADDSKVIRTSASKILGEEFEVLLAVDGQDAWDQISKDREISAVFTDIGMPYLGGLELLARIRAHDDEELNTLPVIVVTGDETEEAREDALQKGATDFITKPFNRVDLLARARSHATARRERKELETFTTIDRLTRLGNEQHFLNTLREARSFSLRHGEALSVLRLQIDDIKAVVKKMGKDDFLRRMRDIGSIIRACIRNEDTAARLEAVHFGIITPLCDHEGALKLAERIQATVAAGAKRAGWPVPLTLSIGVSTPSLNPDMSFEDILEDLKNSAAKAVAAGPNGIGLSDMTANRAQSGAAAPMKIGAALRLLAEGREDAVREQLPALLQRLAPLLQFAQREDAPAFMQALRRESAD